MSDSIRGWSGNRDNRGRFTRGNSYAALGWRAMMELGKTDPATVNAWLRAHLRVEFDEDRRLTVHLI